MKPYPTVLIIVEELWRDGIPGPVLGCGVLLHLDLLLFAAGIRNVNDFEFHPFALHDELRLHLLLLHLQHFQNKQINKQKSRAAPCCYHHHGTRNLDSLSSPFFHYYLLVAGQHRYIELDDHDGSLVCVSLRIDQKEGAAQQENERHPRRKRERPNKGKVRELREREINVVKIYGAKVKTVGMDSQP